MGVVLFAGVAVWQWAVSAATPQPGDARLINMLTTVAMGWSVAAILLSEKLFKKLLSAVDNPARADSAVQTAWIVRAAVREGAAMLGVVVCLLAALKGVLQAFPAYWVNLVPAALFLGFLATRWPSLENLRAQVRQLD